MAIRIEWVGYGREAAEALRAAIAGTKGDDALAPVTVVVPSNHVGVAARRLLASGALGPTCSQGVGLVAVSFVTAYRLAELLGAPRLAATGRRPVSTPVIAAALRASLREEPGLFGPVAEHPATETALVAAYRELREVSPRSLDAIAKKGMRAADVVRLHRATRERLEPAWYDEQDLMRAAAAVIEADATAARDLGAVLLYLPQRLSRHTHLLLDAIATKCEVTTIAGITGVERADADVVTAIQRLAPAAEEPPTGVSEAVATADRTTIVLVSDADEEMRAAVRRVIDTVRAGTPLDRIAILHAGAEPYARLAHEHLKVAGIKTNGPAATPLIGRVAGRALLELLALPERNFRRQDVFAWLTTAPLLRHGRWTPTLAWERLSREAGIVAGREQWNARLTRFVSELEARLASADPEQAEWMAERDNKRLQRARDLRAFVLDLIDDLEQAASRPRAWAAHSRWAREKLTALVGGPSRRDGWPVGERKAAERVEAALDRLAALDPVEGPVGLDVFARTLALELETDLGRVGRFGDGVLVGPISMGIGLDLDLVVVLGLAEGTFPAPVHEDSLLPDHEREAAGDELPLRRARVDRQQRELLASLAGAQRHFLGVPRGDLRRSTDRVPSRWVLDIASALAGARWWTDDLLHARVDWVEHEASFDAGLRTLSFPATEQEHHLRSLLIAGPAGAGDLAATTTDRVLASNAGVVAARRSTAFTRFDGNLDGLAVPSPVDGIMSATRLQTWAGCPFAYFVAQLLRVEQVENPEDTLRISPLDKGSLIHEVLEEFVVTVLARPAGDRPGPDDTWTDDDRALMAEIGNERCDEFEARGLTGRRIFWNRDRARILNDLDRFLHEDDRMRRGRRTRPIAAELAFGFVGANDAVPLTLSDGRALRFRGQADRVDRSDDGSLHVYDYKTGSAWNYRGLTADDPDHGGVLLQLAVYGAAARAHEHDPGAAVRAEYWFVSDGEDFATEGYDVTADVLDRVGATLGTIVTGIEAGVFASRPSALSTYFVECAACDPDGLGVIELRRAWERKRFDPALVAYARLAEPLGDEDDGREGAVDD